MQSNGNFQGFQGLQKTPLWQCHLVKSKYSIINFQCSIINIKRRCIFIENYPQDAVHLLSIEYLPAGRQG